MSEGPTLNCMLAVAQVLSESLGWMAKTVADFGLGALNVKTLVDWMKADMGSTNTAVRAGATALLVAMHVQLGPGLADMLRGSVKPAQMTALEEAFRTSPQQQVRWADCDQECAGGL